MADRTLSNWNENNPTADDSQRCGAAVVAAMQAIDDHCSEDTKPVRLGDGSIIFLEPDEFESLEQLRDHDSKRDGLDDDEIDSAIRSRNWLRHYANDQVERMGMRTGDDGWKKARRGVVRKLLKTR